jgi:hypothetical protein
MYHSGNGVAQDVPRATLFYKKACDAGQSDYCAKLPPLEQTDTKAGAQALPPQHRQASTILSGISDIAATSAIMHCDVPAHVNGVAVITPRTCTDEQIEEVRRGLHADAVDELRLLRR